MSTHNIGFYEDLTKIIFELSSNMHLISSADIETEIQTSASCSRRPTSTSMVDFSLSNFSSCHDIQINRQTHTSASCSRRPTSTSMVDFSLSNFSSCLLKSLFLSSYYKIDFQLR